MLGALSPRTRNAQVELFQNGDVDYLVATDAVGMGLNLDVDHVAFASDKKFDGFRFRKLHPAELGQIAGRAGRYMRDGTFGTAGRCPPFDPDVVEALENHAFDAVRVLQWRNPDLDFSTLAKLQESLADQPREHGLIRAPFGEDVLALEHVAREDDIRGFARSPAAVQRLWDVCQVPDYRKVSPAGHADLVGTLYRFLMKEGAVPAEWFSQPGGDARPHGRRHRHALEPHRAGPHLDLRRQPSRLAEGARALAGGDPSGRGQPVRRPP